MCLKLILKKLRLSSTKDLSNIPKPPKVSNDIVIETTASGLERSNEKPIPSTKATIMTKGDKIVEIARKEIGTVEYPDNSNKVKYNTWFYGKEVSGSSFPWCAVFVSWIFDQSGYPLENIGFVKGFAGVQTGVDHFRKTGQLTDNPVAGDIVMYDWQGDGHFDHTGIFVRSLDETHFEAIEGNTSLANQSNGGMVMLMTRQKNNVLFAHPNVLV